MKGTHRSMEWLVMQYHDGQLPERHRKAVEVHLTECDRCRDYVRSTRSAATWLQATAAGAARAVEFGAVWRGVTSRLEESMPVWFRLRQWVWPPRLGWLAAGSVAAVLLLLLMNPYGRLPVPQSHQAYVAFVEAGDYPVMVLTPSGPDELTVIWFFEPREKEPLPST